MIKPARLSTSVAVADTACSPSCRLRMRPRCNQLTRARVEIGYQSGYQRAFGAVSGVRLSVDSGQFHKHAINLVRRVVVHEADAERTLRQAQSLHSLEGVVVAVP